MPRIVMYALNSKTERPGQQSSYMYYQMGHFIRITYCAQNLGGIHGAFVCKGLNHYLKNIYICFISKFRKFNTKIIIIHYTL